MFSQVTYNVIIERFKAYASGHYLIKRFSHGQIDVADIMKDAEYAWMHVVPVSMNPATGTRSFSFDIIFADMPRDKEEKTEYQRESLSDCIRLAEDLLAEIQNGYTIFGRDVELEEGATITPFMEEYTHVLTGVTLSLTMTFSWDWNACDIPADWTAGGSGSGGTGGGVASLVLKTNGTPNIIQNILDLVDGTGMDIIDLGDGRVQFTSTGGGQSVALVWDDNHLSSTGNPYKIGDVVYYLGSIYRCIAENDSILPTSTTYWTLLGTGYPLRQSPSDWNATDGDNQILNKPTIPTSLADWYTGVNKGDLIAYDGSQWQVRGNLNLNDIQDVSTNNAGNGQVLTFQNNEWIPTTPSFTQVNSDWNATSGVAEILNKPTIPTATSDLTNDSGFITIGDVPTQVQSDWTQTDNTQVDFIKNKPTLPATIGDMTKAVYDTDNDGIVDFAEALKTEVRNSTGATLRKGFIVYLSGSTGNLPNAVLAQANNDANSAQTFGVVYQDIPNNSDGYVVTIGQINTLDTRTTATHPFTSDTLQDGDVIYLSPTTAGWVTRIKPIAPQHIVYVGMVVRTSPTNGTIQYRIQNGYELDEIHDVYVPSPSNNDVLYFETSTQLWKSRQLLASHITDSTDVGRALVTLPNPSAISYIRINANNTIDTRTPAQVLTDLGIASTIILARDNSAYSLTGVSVNTLVYSVAIAPNTLQTNDFIEWISLFNTTALNGQTIAYRIYVNTSASLTGALLLGLYSNSVGTGNTNFQRNIYVTASGVSGNLRVLNTGSNSTSSYGIGAGNATNQTIDTTTTLYFLIAFQPNNTAITTSVQSTLIRITR